MLSVPLDTNVSVEVVVTRRSNTIRNFPSTVLQSPIVLTSLKAGLVSATVSTLIHRNSVVRSARRLALLV